MIMGRDQLQQVRKLSDEDLEDFLCRLFADGYMMGSIDVERDILKIIPVPTIRVRKT